MSPGGSSDPELDGQHHTMCQVSCAALLHRAPALQAGCQLWMPPWLPCPQPLLPLYSILSWGQEPEYRVPSSRAGSSSLATEHWDSPSLTSHHFLELPPAPCPQPQPVLRCEAITRGQDLSTQPHPKQGCVCLCSLALQGWAASAWLGAWCAPWWHTPVTWPRPRCPPCLLAAWQKWSIFLCLQQSPCPHMPVFPMPTALWDYVCPGHPPTAALPRTAAPSPLPIPSPESARSVPAPVACSQPECCCWHRAGGQSPEVQLWADGTALPQQLLCLLQPARHRHSSMCGTGPYGVWHYGTRVSMHGAACGAPGASAGTSNNAVVCM